LELAPAFGADSDIHAAIISNLDSCDQIKRNVLTNSYPPLSISALRAGVGSSQRRTSGKGGWDHGFVPIMLLPLTFGISHL
jgi:hypothetical protein